MFIKLTLSNVPQEHYVLNINHVVDMHRQKDERTCIRLVDGSDIYVDETPTEIVRLVGGALRTVEVLSKRQRSEGCELADAERARAK